MRSDERNSPRHQEVFSRPSYTGTMMTSATQSLVRPTWGQSVRASSSGSPEDKVQDWQGRIDSHMRMQDQLGEIARSQKTKSLKWLGLALLGAAVGVGVAVAAPALMMPALYAGGLAFAGTGMVALKAYSISREAVERQGLGAGMIDACKFVVSQYQAEVDEKKRAQMAAEIEQLTRGLGGGGGILAQTNGALMVGGTRLKQRGA